MISNTSVVLVIPCFNERERLSVASFREYCRPELRMLFVDDGSRDQTADFLEKEFEGNPNVSVLRLPKNQGKAEAIRQAMMHISRTPQFSSATWVGFWDADLATPLGEVANMLKYRELFFPKAEVLFGSRVAKLGSEIHRSYIRHYLGRIFATVIDLMIHVKAYDSQCGAKLFQRHTLEKAFTKPFISRWIFDVEIILRLEGTPIVEYPLLAWKDIPGSKMKIGREALRVLRDILRIRSTYKR